MDPWEQISVDYRPNHYTILTENEFENVVCKMSTILSGPQCVNIATISWQEIDLNEVLLKYV